ncbi:hypothetical protein HPB47_001131 [Ixodes persulcatus]|uniref:Uncharacterized protein n=1 Tax=Ixodes persulcatus TaxID=34615 RepID=A0AC60PPY9_IXOPE|nr:hypothetical protein HPB47_001131 [Ixodes persulcatus]
MVAPPTQPVECRHNLPRELTTSYRLCGNQLHSKTYGWNGVVQGRLRQGSFTSFLGGAGCNGRAGLCRGRVGKVAMKMRKVFKYQSFKYCYIDGGKEVTTTASGRTRKSVHFQLDYGTGNEAVQLEALGLTAGLYPLAQSAVNRISSGSFSSPVTCPPILVRGPPALAAPGRCMTTWPHFSVMAVTYGYTENVRTYPLRRIAASPHHRQSGSVLHANFRPSPTTFVNSNTSSSEQLAVQASPVTIVSPRLPSPPSALLDFRTLLLSYPDTVFAVCETWLHPSTPDGLLVDVENFTIFRKDRASNGGGVLVAVPRHMTCRRRQDLEHEHLEAVFVEVNHHRGKSTSYDLLGDSLKRAGMGNYLNICVLGDFNAHIDWTNPSAPIPSAPLMICYLISWRPAGSLKFVLPGSDHHAIYLESLLKLPKSGPHAKRIQQFSKTDGTHLQNLLHLAPWSLVTEEPCVHDAYDLWLDLFSAIEAECVPTRTTTGRQRPWITQDIIRLSLDGSQVIEPGAIAELFSDHFSSAWTTPGNPSPLPSNMPRCSSPLASFDVREEDVAEALQRINPSQKAEPDGVHPAFLRMCSNKLSPILAKLFTNSLRAGSVPRQWKTAQVTPIHKGSGLSKSLVSSYQPISTTSIVCRTMERIVNRHLLEHIERHQLLSPHQYGFRPGRSCELALATTVHTISSSLDGRTPCELVQLDFKQAFDKVDHSILLQRLSDIGLSGNLLDWVRSFLLGRTQHPIRRPLDHQLLQADLDNAVAWSSKNRLSLNIAKCTVMQISASRQQRSAPPCYNLDGVNISRTTSTKLLGTPHVPRYRDIATDNLLARVGWNSLALCRKISSIRLLATCLLPEAPEVPLARQLRLNRNGGLQPLFARTDRHRNTFVIRAVNLWRSLPSEMTAGLKEKEDIKPICREAIPHLRVPRRREEYGAICECALAGALADSDQGGYVALFGLPGD